MTEAEWLACDDPRVIARFARGSKNASDRKLRLFAVACCRCVWDAWQDARSRQAVEVAEEYADNLAVESKLADARATAMAVPVDRPSWGGASEQVVAVAVTTFRPFAAAKQCSWFVASTQLATVLACAHDIFGNPFHSIMYDQAWRTATVTSLAEAIYADRAFDRLPILADALEDAGCTNRDILDHCRQPGVHVRGCWVVDLVLGKE